MNDLIPLRATHGIHSSSSRTPHKVAIRYGDRCVTYKELVDRMKRVSSGALAFNGKVAIVAKNSIEYLEVLFGVSDVGIPVVTINPKNTQAEVIAALKDSDTKVLFIDESLLKDEYKNYVDTIITFGSQYDSWISGQQPIEQYNEFADDTIYNIVYTSGTTGAPKGICIPHRTRALLSITMALDYKTMGIDDTMLLLVSFFNGGGNGSLLTTLNNGGTVIIGTQMHPDYIMRMVETYSVTGLFLVPALTHMIVSTQSCHKYDRSSLKVIISIAAPFDTPLKKQALEFFNCDIWDLYGTTEHGPVTALKVGSNMPIDSVGVPITFSTVKVVNDEGLECKPYEIGEVYGQTITMFRGYLNGKKAERFVAVGDLGYKDDDGYLFLVGRKNDLIISAGTNIYPEEVELILNKCPGVIESAVIGTPDDRWGEIVTVFIVGMPVVDPVIYCKENLASYKIPRKIFYIDSIPKNDVGKILRKNLRKHYK